MCRFADIAECPLYIESHNGDGLGCVDDMAQPCLVERGKMDYDVACWKIAQRGRSHPGMLQSLKPVGTA